MAGDAGVYAIRNIVNGRIYVGCSYHIWVRLPQHRSQLNCGRHKNLELQADWVKFGPGSFVFERLEHVSDRSKMWAAERHWMGELSKTSDLYNVKDSHFQYEKSRRDLTTPRWEAPQPWV